jgi:FkbM family methyltransferase
MGLSLAPDGRRISYAQNGEDIVVLRAFGEQPSGVWVDVGANHPVHDSVTKNLSDLGWHGINLEPVPDLFDALVQDRPRDTNLCAAASDTDGTAIFSMVTSNPGLSTFDGFLSAVHRESGHDVVDVEVPVVRLESVCAQYLERPTIDLMKIDVEGHELAVLRGHDFARFPVRLLLAEATDDTVGPIREHLQANNMTFVTFDGLNAWFVADEEADRLGPLIARPPSAVLDWFHPAIYLEMLDEREARIAALTTALEAARHDA